MYCATVVGTVGANDLLMVSSKDAKLNKKILYDSCYKLRNNDWFFVSCKLNCWRKGVACQGVSAGFKWVLIEVSMGLSGVS